MSNTYHYLTAINNLPEAGQTFLARAEEIRKKQKEAEALYRDCLRSAESLWEEIQTSGLWTEQELNEAEFPK